MTKNLNESLAPLEPDNLIYDAAYPVDVNVVEVSVADIDKNGSLLRGQLLDLAEGVYSLHSAGGKANVVVAQDTEYDAEDTSVSVPVYAAGTFRQESLISDVEVTADDVERLRGVGIILK